MADDMTLAEFLSLTRDEQQRRAGRRAPPEQRPEWVSRLPRPLPPLPRTPPPEGEPPFPFPIGPGGAMSPPAPVPGEGPAAAQVRFSDVAMGPLSAPSMAGFDDFGAYLQATYGAGQPQSGADAPPGPVWTQQPTDNLGRNVVPIDGQHRPLDIGAPPINHGVAPMGVEGGWAPSTGRLPPVSPPPLPSGAPFQGGEPGRGDQWIQGAQRGLDSSMRDYRRATGAELHRERQRASIAERRARWAERRGEMRDDLDHAWASALSRARSFLDR